METRVYLLILLLLVVLMKRLSFIIFFLVYLKGYSQNIHRIAGDSLNGFSGDGGNAINSLMDFPYSVATDSIGNIYIADAGNNRIRMIEKSTGIIKTIAGGGINIPGNGDTATLVNLDAPNVVILDKNGNIYFSESNRCVVRKIDKATGLVNIICGTIGSAGFSGDGGQALAAQLRFPSGLCLDETRNLLYISDGGNYRIRKIDLLSGIISTVAGNGTQGLSGDGGLATNAQIGWVSGITVDSAGNIFFSDPNARIRTINYGSGIVTTFAGTTSGFSGDGGPAISSSLTEASNLCFDPEFANLYFSDWANSRVRKINITSGIIETIAGGGASGWVGNNGPAVLAALDWPNSVCVSRTHDIIIADTYHNQIRKIYGDQTGYYYQFPDSNAVWNFHNNRYCMGGPNDYYYSVTMPGDTFINSKLYHKLSVSFVTPSGVGTCTTNILGYQGSVREDTAARKVFIIPSGSSTEELLYDFNMHVGDTVRGYLASGIFLGSKDYVHSLDSVMVGSSYRKRWHLNNTYAIYLIEGVGSTYGLVKPSVGEIADVDLCYLDCFGQNEQTLYPDTVSLCQQINGIDIISSSSEISLFPNPATNRITLQSPVALEQVKIYDVLGKDVTPLCPADISPKPLSSINGGISPNSGERERVLSFDISRLPAGVYTVQSGNLQVKFVKQ